MLCSIAAIAAAFPQARVAFVRAEVDGIAPARDAALAARIEAVERDVAGRYAATPLGEIAPLAEWRRAYKAFGVKKTSFRSSVERLVRLAVRGDGLPCVNALVDAYNCVSLTHLVPVGADDLDRVEGGVCFRPGRPGDTFFALGREPGVDDPPAPGEIVYADASKCLCRRWNWYQDGRSAVSPGTRRIVLTVQALEQGDVETAAADLCDTLTRHCGARTTRLTADAGTPEVTL